MTHTTLTQHSHNAHTTFTQHSLGGGGDSPSKLSWQADFKIIHNIVALLQDCRNSAIKVAQTWSLL